MLDKSSSPQTMPQPQHLTSLQNSNAHLPYSTQLSSDDFLHQIFKPVEQEANVLTPQASTQSE
jgi:hypothetical protein